MSRKQKLQLGRKDISTKSLRTKLSKELSDEFNQPITVTEQDILDALELSHGSKVAAKLVNTYARVLAKSIGLNTSAAVSDPSTKILKRIFSKAIANYDKIVSDVPDIGRMRLLVTGPKDVEKLREILLGKFPTYTDKRVGFVIDRNPTNEITINEVEDFYLVPSVTGRIGMHITLSVKISGNVYIPFEIQVMDKDMVKTEDFTRSNYTNAQAIKRTANVEDRELTLAEQEAIEVLRL